MGANHGDPGSAAGRGRRRAGGRVRRYRRSGRSRLCLRKRLPGWGGNADVAMAAQSSGGLVMTSIDSSDVVDFYAEAPGGSTWSQTRITGISFPMDTPAIAAN